MNKIQLYIVKQFIEDYLDQEGTTTGTYDILSSLVAIIGNRSKLLREELKKAEEREEEDGMDS